MGSTKLVCTLEKQVSLPPRLFSQGVWALQNLGMKLLDVILDSGSCDLRVLWGGGVCV